jgi:hypothetical protein
MITLSNPSQRILLSMPTLSSMVIPSLSFGIGYQRGSMQNRKDNPGDGRGTRCFKPCRVRGPGYSIICSINTLPSLAGPCHPSGGMRRAPESQDPPESDFINLLSALGALLERGLFTPLQEPFGVQKAVKLDKLGHEPGPAGLVAGA